VPSNVPVHALPKGSTKMRCARFLHRKSAHLGGPAALLLDESLEVLVGRWLDSLYHETDDGSWPELSDDPDAARVTVVIE